MPDLFDMKIRGLRRDRAARLGPDLFLHERAFADCLERIALQERRFDRALLVGSPHPAWPDRLREFVDHVEVRDPGPIFAKRSGGEVIVEDAWLPEEDSYDLVVALGTLDSVNYLPLALRLIRHAMRDNALLLGAVAGGDTLPQLRNAMRAADASTGGAAPHVHPRLEAAAIGPLLNDAGFVNPVVDVDRVSASYRSLSDLVRDLRSMAATNVLTARPRFVGREARDAASAAFAAAGDGERTIETFEIVHFAAWTPRKG